MKKPFVSLVLVSALILLSAVLCACSSGEDRPSAEALGDRMVALSSDLFLTSSNETSLTEIYSTDFRTGKRSHGLAVLYLKRLPLIPSISTEARPLEFSFDRIHDDERIPINAPSSAFYVVTGLRDYTELRIGSDKENRPAGPATYRVQTTVKGIFGNSADKFQVVWPIVSPSWSIPIEQVSARFHFMRPVSSAGLNYSVVRTSHDGPDEGIIEPNAIAKLDYDPGTPPSPVVLVVTGSPIGKNQGLYLVVTWNG